MCRHARTNTQVTTLGGGGLGLDGLLQPWLRAGRVHQRPGLCRLLLSTRASAFQAQSWPQRCTPATLAPRVRGELVAERLHDAGRLDALVEAEVCRPCCARLPARQLARRVR